ncbi:hypothetical protein [Pseudodesulfovibrio hydrargyri]|uniref:hypothetical protein n=1 Tax=Pseudodesulfovibrio hydrargyri TaxID=2125990 RepID=UPI00101AD551|nr:hypothetical protein [Pseudodesulfovibrio hydrargyri]
MQPDYAAWRTGGKVGFVRMLHNTEVKDSIRKFDVIGYAEFESKIELKNKWINIVIELFNNVDLYCIQNDYRVKQLYEILRASASIIIEINNLNIDSRPFTSQNINDAKLVIEN